ncbi:vir-repressed protein [Chromobacterium vaccinii]|uniref:vir-repressed protein n=1 Tax=Chromobacterium vaccinii TaxID=1108595 RepID=UPI001E4738CF|nr:vir-repressed protein [Chromobacterium vaccinii]MCD4500434.1 vir-repressed protein [Chromobacterium vaccinii]
MKQWILAAVAISSLAGCVVEPPRVAMEPMVVRPAVVVPAAPAYYYGYGPRYGWR